MADFPLSAELMTRLRLADDHRMVGRRGIADLVCRQVLQAHPEALEAHLLLGRIASDAGEHLLARRHFAAAQRLGPDHREAERELLGSLRRLREEGASRKDAHDEERFLVCRAWGYGFFSDLEMVLAALLTAELTGRTPIVHWGERSRFRGGGVRNAWTSFFDPVASASLEQVAPRATSWFPPVWSSSNALEAEGISGASRWARLHPLDTFGREETVVVWDYHGRLYDVLPWIPDDHPWFALSPLEVARRLVARLRPAAAVKRQAASWWASRFAGAASVAVHLRGPEKGCEQSNVGEVNEALLSRVEALLASRADVRVFAMTDSDSVEALVRARLGRRVHLTECLRTDRGPHNENDDPAAVGREVLIDALIAAKCDRFFGNGWSNVSNFVSYLRDWDEAACHLEVSNFMFEHDPRYYWPPDEARTAA